VSIASELQVILALVPLLSVVCTVQELAAPERARDPWVFRSVLDQKPRMVTFALNEEMWAAYDATTCTLYKVWKGGVHFDGAVYTTVHGPQPTSEGTSYTESVEGPAWEAFVNDKLVESRMRWKGYVFHDGRCTMNYEIELADGRRIGVLETPEFTTPDELFDPATRDGWALVSGQPGFRRSFFASEIPADVKITLKVSTDGMVGKFCELEERAETSGTKKKGSPDTSETVKHSYLHVVLNAEKRGNNLVLFYRPIPRAKAAQAPGADGAEKK
jgi:cytochrome c